MWVGLEPPTPSPIPIRSLKAQRSSLGSMICNCNRKCCLDHMLHRWQSLIGSGSSLTLNIAISVKPIFYQNSDPFRLGPRVGLDEDFALPIPTCEPNTNPHVPNTILNQPNASPKRDCLIWVTVRYMLVRYALGMSISFCLSHFYLRWVANVKADSGVIWVCD